MLKEDKENANNGKQKDSVREETSVVSDTMWISVQNRHQKPLHPRNHQHKEVEVTFTKRNFRGWSQSIWEVRSTAVQRLLERNLHQITV